METALLTSRLGTLPVLVIEKYSEVETILQASEELGIRPILGVRTKLGGRGSGRALGCGEVEFAGQIRPHDRCVRYEIDIRRFTKIAHAGATLVIGDATLLVDDEPIYTIKRAKVGTFRDIRYPDYPNPSEQSRGGRMER